jgi:hypothetical protein
LNGGVAVVRCEDAAKRRYCHAWDQSGRDFYRGADSDCTVTLIALPLGADWLARRAKGGSDECSLQKNSWLTGLRVEMNKLHASLNKGRRYS